MKLIVNVTRDHIQKGKRKNSFSCPIALAIAPLVRGNISVTAGRVYVWYMGVYYDGCLPPEARYFVLNFDTKIPVKPLMFQLELRSAAELAI